MNTITNNGQERIDRISSVQPKESFSFFSFYQWQQDLFC